MRFEFVIRIRTQNKDVLKSKKIQIGVFEGKTMGMPHHDTRHNSIHNFCTTILCNDAGSELHATCNCMHVAVNLNILLISDQLATLTPR
eukprot:scaffold8545_cov129-Skeletonema_marinoi.AAC.5